MSVYTLVGIEDARRFLADYTVGELLHLAAISSGIENTNYFLHSTRGEYVLTLYERSSEAQLSFTLDWMGYLANAHLPVPQPQIRNVVQSADNQKEAQPISQLVSNALYGYLHQKPASIVTKLCGESKTSLSIENCQQLGSVLARMHLVGQAFNRRFANPRGQPWCLMTVAAIRAFLQPQQTQLLEEALAVQHQHAVGGLSAPDQNLPQGPIHGDLFPDNLLWHQNKLSGVIDFGFAASDTLSYDLAIAANACCSQEDGSLDVPKMEALLQGYQQHRALHPLEQQAWPILLQGAALRFWLSRLYDFFVPRSGITTHTHNPDVFENILRHRLTNSSLFPL